MLDAIAGVFGFDKEEATFTTIQSTLQKLAKELNCNYNELWIMILPIDENFSMKFHVYKMINSKPTPIRDISLKEVLGIKEEKNKK